MNLKAAYVLFKKACLAWADDDAPSRGAAIASLLLTTGKALMGLYLATSAVA